VGHIKGHIKASAYQAQQHQVSSICFEITGFEQKDKRDKNFMIQFPQPRPKL